MVAVDVMLMPFWHHNNSPSSSLHSLIGLGRHPLVGFFWFSCWFLPCPASFCDGHTAVAGHVCPSQVSLQAVILSQPPSCTVPISLSRSFCQSVISHHLHMSCPSSCPSHSFPDCLHHWVCFIPFYILFQFLRLPSILSLYLMHSS